MNENSSAREVVGISSYRLSEGQRKRSKPPDAREPCSSFLIPYRRCRLFYQPVQADRGADSARIQGKNAAEKREL